jgi:poly(ADP-ribose) glycohydrolase
MYLSALFIYFETPNAATDTDMVEFSLHSSSPEHTVAEASWSTRTLVEASVVNIPSYSTAQQESACQGLNGAVVVSANKDIGFGQSATQEELYVGNCPEACPAVLITPTLGSHQVLVIRGARPILRITGQRREITWSILDPPALGGRMLFMDALEIDEVEGSDGILPDLQPNNIEREISKACVAFSAWESDETATIWSGLWGCGAFNGDPGVKMCILWIAASLARKNLQILCDASQCEFSALLEKLIANLGRTTTVGELRDWLGRIPPTTRRLETIPFLLAAMCLEPPISVGKEREV